MVKYIIDVACNEAFTKIVVEILRGKGYAPHQNIENHYGNFTFVRIHHDGLVGLDTREEGQELTFRQLCELPPVYDEMEELAEHIKKQIERWFNQKAKLNDDFGWKEFIKQTDFCNLWDNYLKKKLGL